MAVRYAIKTGNWTDPTMWDGGSLPTSDDTVYANTYTVSINTSVVVNSLKLSSLASPVIAQGGQFRPDSTSGPITVEITSGISSADYAISGASKLLYLVGSNPITLTAPFFYGGRAGTQYCIEAPSTGFTGSLTINGDLWSGNYTGTIALSVQRPNQTIVVNGSLRTQDVSGAHCFLVNALANITINGSIYGSNSSNICLSVAGGTGTHVIAVNGTIAGGGPSNYAAFGVSVAAGQTATITADTITGFNSPGINVLGTANLTFREAVAGVNRDEATIRVGAGSTLTARGRLVGSYAGTALGAPAGTTASVRFSGEIVCGPTGVFPIKCTFYAIRNEELVCVWRSANIFSFSNLASRTTPLYGRPSPAPSDVLASVAFGNKMGTLSLPATSQVAAGVGVGEDIGTATLPLTTLADKVGSELVSAVGG